MPMYSGTRANERYARQVTLREEQRVEDARRRQQAEIEAEAKRLKTLDLLKKVKV